MAESNWWEEWEVPNFDDWGYDAGSDQDDPYGLTAGLGSLMEDESWMSDLFDPSDWSYDQSFDPGDDSWMSDLFDSWSYDTGSAQDDPYGILSSLDQYGFGDSEQPWDLWNSMASANQQANQPAEDKGMFGLGIGPRLKDFFLGSDSGDSANKWGGFLGSLLGSPGTAGAGGTGLLGGIGGLLGGFGESPLGQLLLLRYLNDKHKKAEYVPIGQQAFAHGNVTPENVPDYRIFNLQPALMPGVGYANQAPPDQAPPGMKHGGIASLSSEGPGDITLAKLEPGEFVMTRKATQNIGAQNLYKLMKEAERMS